MSLQRLSFSRRVPSRINGFKNVVTGYKYPNSKTKYPESQYCYVEIKSSGLTRKNLWI